MSRPSSSRWGGFALLVVAASLVAPVQAQEERGGPVCSVALPPKCMPAGASEPVVESLAVTELEASGVEDCVERARRLVSACSPGPGARELVRFRRGAVDKIRDLSETAARRLPAEVKLPIVYGKGFESELEQFGYSPDFSPGPMSFDNDGRMLVRSGNFLQVRGKDGGWTFIDLSVAFTAAIQRLPDVAGFRWILDNRAANADLNVYVDARNRWYTLVQGMPSRLKVGSALTMRPYLLASSDGGQSWIAVALALPDDSPSWRATIEHNDGNNDRGEPPPVLTFDQNEREAARSPALFLWTFRWDGADLAGTSLKISDRSILVDNHSGGANSLVSTGDRIYIVYPGMTDKKARGTPAYLVIYDKAKGAVESEVMLAHAGAAASADNHNIPGICFGRERSVHVLLPGHQEDLRMVSGRLGADGKASFGEPRVIGDVATRAGGYTYGTLNCDPAGNIFIASRWAGDQYRFQLVLLHRQPQGEWKTWNRRKHMAIVDPGRPFYGAWRQRAAQDSGDRLYIQYAYYANHLSASELAALKSRFPFENWKAAKELSPPQCVAGAERRCFMHPMPEVTHVMLSTDTVARSWRFVP